ncbi:MAG: isoprenoid biosynthesis glyoxalase ElbB [Proteobacteria bacterium]|nr:isoprenoid biosynthesis glyoxalase ElbB [Pseudomonadota bacterium]
MRFAVILSGCGVRDGSEIHESVFALLAIEQGGHSVSIFAPDKPQSAVINGVSGRPMNESRNILVESARIARGAIKPLSELDVMKFDAIVLPGGFGAACNLCDFAQKGAGCDVDGDVKSILIKAQQAGKALGFMCIAPVIAARVFGHLGVRLTIGDDPSTAKACEAMGAKHVVCRVDEVCLDETLRIATTPAYMLAHSMSECYASARALVNGIEQLLS